MTSALSVSFLTLAPGGHEVKEFLFNHERMRGGDEPGVAEDVIHAVEYPYVMAEKTFIIIVGFPAVRGRRDPFELVAEYVVAELIGRVHLLMGRKRLYQKIAFLKYEFHEGFLTVNGFLCNWQGIQFYPVEFSSKIKGFVYCTFGQVLSFIVWDTKSYTKQHRRTSMELTMILRKLRAIRVIKGKSHEDIAMALGCSRCAYSCKENGKTGIVTEEWMKIAEFLDVPVGAFFLNVPIRIIPQCQTLIYGFNRVSDHGKIALLTLLKGGIQLERARSKKIKRPIKVINHTYHRGQNG